MEGPGPREALSGNLTQQSNAGHSGAFLAPKGHSLASGGNVATVCAQSTFERPLSCVGDSDAGDRNLLPAYCLAMRRGKAVFDQVSYHIDVEPMGEQSCSAAAAQPCIGQTSGLAPAGPTTLPFRHACSLIEIDVGVVNRVFVRKVLAAF